MSHSRLIDASILAFKAFCATVIFFALSFSVYMVGPAIETRYFPAVSKLRILSLEPDGPSGMSRIQAEFTKLRNCEYLGIAWFLRDEIGGFERVPIILQRRPGDLSSPNRPTGVQRAGPWLVALKPDILKHQSFALLSHKCHPFWITTTEFYP